MPQAESQPLNQGDAGGGSTAQRSSLTLLLGGGGLLAVGVLIGTAITFVVKPSGTATVVNSQSSGGLADSRSGELACGSPGSFEWQALSSIDPLAKDAIAKGLGLLQTQREDCEGGSFPPFPFRAKDFQRGENHSHYVHVHHKFATTCSGETFKLHYFTGAASKTAASSKTSFVVEVHRDTKTGVWQPLRSNPLPCDIALGTTAYPETIPSNEKLAKEASTFAANELGYQMRKAQCLGAKDVLKVTEIKQVRTQVTAGLQIELLLLMTINMESGKVSDPNAARLWVEEKCDLLGKGTCVKELQIPQAEGSACSVLKDPAGIEMRRLLGKDLPGGLGHIQPDATESLAARRELLAPRRLGEASSGSRAPMLERHMEKGSVPSSFDPRGTSCYEHVVVYDQGSCGSCYANAVAAVIGIRQCLFDKDEEGNGRRLKFLARRLKKKGHHHKKEEEEKEEKEVKEMKEKKHPMNAASSSSSGGQPQCVDSKTWADQYGDGCDWYEEHDPGCEKYTDEGQVSHCQKACNSCPTVVDQDSGDNPWHAAWYTYMPSISELATCAKRYDGSTPGCDGGNTDKIWNYWMRHLEGRDLWAMGESCLPYDLKCWSAEPGAVVNTLTGGACSSYEGYQLFHKPCHCIADGHRPTSYQCPSEAPKKSSCKVAVPAAMFTVKTMQHGLSNQDAVLNFQRHIHEYGPIYMSFDTSESFMGWDWGKRPVYTGGGQAVGGHAVIGIGWGKHDGVDYWLLRNSWGKDYVDGGHFKFRRGVNLDNLEASETTASMPTEDYADWSAPFCDLTQQLTEFAHSGSQLIDYTLKVEVTCNKDASLNVFFSNKLEDRDAIYNGGVSGRRLHADAKAKEGAKLELDMICRKYGLENGEMWIKITSEDSKGNEGKTTHFLSIPAVDGMTTTAGCR